MKDLKNLTGLCKFLLLLTLASYVSIGWGCSKENKNPAVEYGETELSRYDIKNKSPEIKKLIDHLREISGLTMTPDGRLFAHNDEKGRIFQIDYGTGDVVKSFDVGDPVKAGDFEDIAYANGMFYLINSKGELYEFKEGEDKQSVQFTKYETGLNSRNDVEGLAYDPNTNSLLIACKGNPGKDVGYRKKAVYSFSLESKTLSEKPRFVIDLDKIGDKFSPSAIEYDPNSNTFFIIASEGNGILEMTPEGEVINYMKLPGKVHIQPEGITFAPDKRLIISNEGRSGDGYIVIYDYMDKK